MIKPAYSVSFLLSRNIVVWPNVLYFPNDPRARARVCVCVYVCVCVCGWVGGDSHFLFHPGVRWGMGGQRQALAALSPEKRPGTH